MLQNGDSNRMLIVGLGNPGKQFEKTRHNIGFEVLDLLAKKHGLVFKTSAKVKGSLAKGVIYQAQILLLKPLTFMNLSGESVALAMRYYSIDVSKMLVIVDDSAIAMGRLRMRVNSGSGGHNGLKSIEEALETDRYARLRLGIGDPQIGDLASHVLARFSEEEALRLPAVLERAVESVDLFIEKGLTRAMDFANQKIE